ncbi:unnamed protein product [Didymodactylos carnosus]|uniref:Uncharacterized protein n=1 Tax=Didymodactylos carnosus TaxID=1234261 RepID=A0A815E2Q2_9BILA|nr:unnamed protein product [Didymodactylos carnosus]CAF1305688.1 unnamed protein product [Didymodactylos carnosus]CAF3606926.1 unnamed protein product [Didymodactylos carnosus]CAF4138661.1 unnamed protein product [Didymodactylos carnosus]
MFRFLDAMAVLLTMKKDGCLTFSQTVDETFVMKAKQYIRSTLMTTTSANGDITTIISLAICEATDNLYDNYSFKTTTTLFNVQHSSSSLSSPSNEFSSILGENPTIEKRLLQLPLLFFFRSDLVQPTFDDNGSKSNGPFHHINGDELNRILKKLVAHNLLTMGNFITRPKARPAPSFIKNVIRAIQQNTKISFAI